MDRLYPDVMSYVREVKRRDYRLLAQRMQRQESSFIFNHVVDYIRNRWPDMWLVTIHDSILCLPEDLRTVRGIMEQKFCNLGTEAVLREERY